MRAEIRGRLRVTAAPEQERQRGCGSCHAALFNICFARRPLRTAACAASCQQALAPQPAGPANEPLKLPLSFGAQTGFRQPALLLLLPPSRAALNPLRRVFLCPSETVPVDHGSEGRGEGRLLVDSSPSASVIRGPLQTPRSGHSLECEGWHLCWFCGGMRALDSSRKFRALPAT